MACKNSKKEPLYCTLVDIPNLDNYICKFCTGILDKTHQIDSEECSCRICEACFKENENELKKKETCEFCKGKFGKTITSNIDKAFEIEIGKLMVICQMCTWSGTFKEFKEKHKKDHPSSCPYSTVGCKVDTSQNKTLKEHSDTCVNQHLVLLMQNFDTKFKNLEDEVAKFVSLNVTNKKDQKLTVENAASNTQMLDSRISVLIKETENMKLKLKKPTENYLGKLEGYLGNLNEIRDELDRIKSQQMLTRGTMIELEQSFLNMKTNYEGKLLWKIENTKKEIEKMKNYKSKLVSKAFYLSKYGYKLQAQIGVDNSNSWLSTDVVPLKGEYDALLKWPLKLQKITFVIFDQKSEEAENIIGYFKPVEPNKPRLESERDKKEIFSIPKFCELNKLQSSKHAYINDADCMFIKVDVDTRDLDK